MLIYTAGPYNQFDDGAKIWSVNENIQSAREASIALWNEGYAVLCPHLNTANFDIDCQATWENYIKGDLRMVACCDAIVMLPRWEYSIGAKMEKEFAWANGIPVYIWPERPVKPVTEEKSPAQCRAFLNAVMSMYRVHLAKNADYSPANILGTGEIGLVTRIWDKTARLLNLLGFRIHIDQSTYEKPSSPKNESINDTLMDLAVYAVIGMLLRKGAWGK